MKLALVIGSLGGGGAERVMAMLANAWSRRGAEVTVVTVDNSGSDRYELDPAVKRISLDLMRRAAHWWQGAVNNIRRVRALRVGLRTANPDAIISFLTSTNVLSVLAAGPLGVPVIISERSSSHERPPVVWRLLRILVYRTATAIVVQTRRGSSWFAKRTPKVPVHVIPNPVQVDFDMGPDLTARRVLNDCRNRNVLIAVGRLAVEKGHDILIRAFARVAGDRPDWLLLILGEGPERNQLVTLSRELGVADRVLLPGFSGTPPVLLQRAQLFVLPSRYEGFPNALLEAMACGLPCVSSDCPNGPAELIDHLKSGLLVPPENVEALAAALAQLMDDPSLRQRLGRAARAGMATYSLESIVAQWQTLFEACGFSLR